MKRFVLAWMCFLALVNFSSMAYAGEYDDLEKYGFRLIKDNKEKLHIIRLNKENNNIVISKKRFKNSKDALKFCNQQHLTFKNSEYVMFLLAMSGVAYNHDFIKKAISFDFSQFPESEHSFEKDKKTGVWSWLGAEVDMITLMYDGEGMNGHEISLAEINKTLSTEITLPALCSDASLWDPLS